jgi:hypothetical protein
MLFNANFIASVLFGSLFSSEKDTIPNLQQEFFEMQKNDPETQFILPKEWYWNKKSLLSADRNRIFFTDSLLNQLVNEAMDSCLFARIYALNEDIPQTHSFIKQVSDWYIEELPKIDPDFNWNYTIIPPHCRSGYEIGVFNAQDLPDTIYFQFGQPKHPRNEVVMETIITHKRTAYSLKIPTIESIALCLDYLKPDWPKIVSKTKILKDKKTE